MQPIRLLSAAEQVAEQLRAEIAKQRLGDEIPGIYQLAASMVVNHKTVKAALRLLEKEGLLESQGHGKPRRIVSRRNSPPKGLMIAILLYEPDDRKLDFLIDLQHQLRELGHTAFFATKTLGDFRMDLKRVVSFVSKTKADTWIVIGASGEILNWFADRAQPAYALFGRQPSVNIGGVGTLKSPAMVRAVQRLVELGHQRIVMLTRPERRKPSPGVFERHFLEALAEHGIQTAEYHLPDWEDNSADLRRCLDSLFAYTPPTALLLSEPKIYFTVLQYLSSRGIMVPRHVSMICGDTDPVFGWAESSISHLRWDTKLLSRSVLRWVRQVARGKDIRRQAMIEAEFVEGTTIGPAKR